MVIIVVIVVNWCAIVVLFSMSEGFLRVLGEVRHMLLVLVVRVTALVSHWVLIATMQTAMMVRAVIEVMLFIVVSIVVSVLHMLHLVSGSVMVHILNVVLRLAVMFTVHMLNIMVTMDNDGVMVIDFMMGFNCFVLRGSLLLWCLIESVAISIAVVGTVWLIVSTMAVSGVWVMSEVCSLARCVVLHHTILLVIAVVLAVVQVLLPGVDSVVTRHLMDFCRIVDLLVLDIMSIIVISELIFVWAGVLRWHDVLILIDALVVQDWLVILLVVPLFTVDLGLVVVMVIVVSVGWTNFTWVSMIVGTL